MPLLDKLDYYVRLIRTSREFMQSRPGADPVAAVRERFERRDVDFVMNVKRVIFDNPANPYHLLFRAAGCEYSDFAASIQRKGIEGTLADLHREGVYVAHDEFKGRKPIVRRGVEVQAAPKSFANPFVKTTLGGSSSGSSGAPVRAPKGLEARLYRRNYDYWVDLEFDLNKCAWAELKGILPDTSGINSVLRRSRKGRVDVAWFPAGGTWRDAWHFRLATYGMLMQARSMGYRPPFPRFLEPGDYSPVARWIAERRARGIPCASGGMVSVMARVAAAALDNGLDISGSKFSCGGEALTEGKRAVMDKAGVIPMPNYHINEIGVVGRSCAQMTDANRVHNFSDSNTAISYRRQAPLSDIEVESLLFTTLLPFTPILMINVEMDDSGVIVPARCNCSMSKMGWNREIRDIFSYGKLTGQGMTLVGTDVVRILEVALPAKFGGKPGDFQLVEREGMNQTEMDLYVTPRLSRALPDAVYEHFFQELRGRQGGLPAEWQWRQSNGLRVVVAEPVATRTGKVHSLRLLGASKAVSLAS